jgi:hypothetical protein
MAINPELITTIRVDQLPDEALSLTNLIPHSVGTDLKSATIQELVDLVATAIGVSGGVGYIAISVTDGQQLPDVPELPSFFLCGAGTFLNINGYPDIICTENLNAIMSLTDHWELAVEIPINPLSGTVQSVTGSAVDNTDPLNPVINEIIYGVQNIIAGTNITVDNTDPANPIVSATGGGGTPTLQEVLDNNHDLVDGNNFQGTGAGATNTGTDVNAFGAESSVDNTGNNVNALGRETAIENTGSNLNAFGYAATTQNSGDNVNALGASAAQYNIANNVNAMGLDAARSNSGEQVNAMGEAAGLNNTFNNVNLFGENATANEDGQTVFSKDGTIMACFGTIDLTDTRKYNLPDADGTIALISDIVSQVNSDWNATSGVAEILNKPTIPSSSTFVPYTGATANVDLGTHKLLAEDLDINHTSGSGDAATITKGGSGEALKVVKTSGSGNAASITGGVTLLDELHLTTDLADAYIASASTWNAKQNALSYTPYKNIQTSQTVHTGTTAETLMLTATIPAGAFNSNDIMKVLYGANKTTNLGTFVLRLRINTTNTISGAPTIAIYNGSTSNQSDVVMRNYHLFGGNLLAHSFVTSTISDIFASPGLSSTPLNPANQFYIFFTITLNNASDNIIANMLSIHN